MSEPFDGVVFTGDAEEQACQKRAMCRAWAFGLKERLNYANWLRGVRANEDADNPAIVVLVLRDRYVHGACPSAWCGLPVKVVYVDPKED